MKTKIFFNIFSILCVIIMTFVGLKNENIIIQIISLVMLISNLIAVTLNLKPLKK